MSIKPTSILIFIVIIAETYCIEETNNSDLMKCELGPLREEIAAYDKVVKKIIDFTTNGDFKGKTYNELAKFVDNHPHRLAGSKALEKAIDYMIELCKDEDLYQIITDYAEIPHWERGHENLTILQPKVKNIPLLGLGPTVSTPPDGITAEVIVFNDFATLESTPKDQIEGKIVLFNPKYTTYNETVQYRLHGATKASAKGAIASLVRSITPVSIYSPHTGQQIYGDNAVKIPAAAITVEDADLINRMYDRNETVMLHIKMNSTIHNTMISRNMLVDIRGTEDTDKLVIVSGHIDSWDVGQGAMDDGSGIILAWAVPSILNRLELTHKRPMRSIFWTAEEFGYVGAKRYDTVHNNDNDDINFIMEADEGTFAPLGLAVSGSHQARCIIAEILKLFKSINSTMLIAKDYVGSDISVFTKQGIPGASLHTENSKYFWYHHSEGDTMSVLNSRELDLCAAFWTAVAYIVADLSVDIPR